MSASKRKTVDAALTLADCIVRAARGHQRTDGGVAWSGMLFIRDCPAASFSNDGNGGCCNWQVRAPQLFREFEALAKATTPVAFEHADHLVGSLWDVAYSKPSAMGGK